MCWLVNDGFENLQLPKYKSWVKKVPNHSPHFHMQ